MALYEDRWITCKAEAIAIRAYYIPWGTKRIRYDAIRGVVVVPIGVGSGRARIWGTANPSLWASLDPQRPGKRRAIIFDLGRTIRPFITPDDVDAVAQIIAQETGVSVTTGSGRRII